MPTPETTPPATDETMATTEHTEAEATAAEAIYGFAAWLTTRRKAVTFGSHYDAAVVAELVNEYCAANGFAEVREGFHTRLRWPPLGARWTPTWRAR